jgi:methionyl-tRNA formyltransferase
VNYAHKIDKAESRLDWRLPAAQLARRVRAFDPAPGTTFQRGNDVCKAWSATADEGAAPADAQPGQVLAAGPAGLLVACGTGVLRLAELQRPGGKRLQVREFLAGYPVAAGELLG